MGQVGGPDGNNLVLALCCLNQPALAIPPLEARKEAVARKAGEFQKEAPAQHQIRSYTAIPNFIKARHEAVKNWLSDIR
jgi:hypothetical protein